jgi:hypothetical protein
VSADGRRACAAPGCGRPLPAGRRRFCCELCRRRGQRAERVTETDDFGQMVIRMIRTLSRRVGATDTAEFGALWDLVDESGRAAAAAIDELRASGFSWAQIAAETPLTRQGLHQWRQRHDRRSGVNKTRQREGQ